jgi:glycerophosphoryl diester phosphodiesterase
MRSVRSVGAPTAVQAHRGSPDLASGIRENTLDAFDRARALGADGVELDVRLTADGGLVVHHDPVVEGMGTVCELATAELPAYIPLLAEALAACAGMVVNIEIKNQPHEPGFDPTDRVAGVVVALVASMGRTGSVVVSSFWSGSLSAARAAGSTVSTGLLVVSSFDPMASIGAAADLGCTAVHLPVGLVDRATGLPCCRREWTRSSPTMWPRPDGPSTGADLLLDSSTSLVDPSG